jgi:CHAT domain-containing protein
MGVPDQLAPEIDKEARAVAAVLPGSRLLLGDAATESSLRALGPESRLIHISTHGLFRRDNPMFSSIRLGDGQLSLIDLYRIRLSAGLVTLSGCSTGLSAVVGGDELLGLVRGLLYAGAASALVTLWDVSDNSTTDFMTAFYPSIAAGRGRAEALRTAMLRVREAYPNPYHWAPFLLVGCFS